MNNMVSDEGTSSEIIAQLARIANALEAGHGGSPSKKPVPESEVMRNVQAIGWMFYLMEKTGRVSKSEIARRMGYADNTGLRRLGTFNALFDRTRSVERASLKPGSTRRNGRNLVANEVEFDDE